MKTIATLVIAGFVGILFLGFLPMNHSVHQEMTSSCPMVSTFSSECTDGFMMALIHIALAGFLLSAPLASFLVAIAILSVLGVLLICGNSESRSIFRTPPRLFSDDLPIRNKLRYWLSLFEHSPSIA